MNFTIIGGTGTLGQELTLQLLKGDPKASITILSRDELKQQAMRQALSDYRHVRFQIGDIRDPRSLHRALANCDVAFHVAAMKHIDVVEDNPVEAVRTNVDGTINVAEVALDHCVSRVVFSSTDKAVLPINVYGHTKAINERYLLGLNREQPLTRFAVYRWGNVIGSRGSVVHRFAETLVRHRRVDITDPEMTRFWLTIDSAARFMIESYQNASLTTATIPPMKAASVLRVAAAVSRAVGVKQYRVNVVGMRPGEKVHEAIQLSAGGPLTSDTAEQYTDAELDALIRPCFARSAA